MAEKKAGMTGANRDKRSAAAVAAARCKQIREHASGECSEHSSPHMRGFRNADDRSRSQMSMHEREHSDANRRCNSPVAAYMYMYPSSNPLYSALRPARPDASDDLNLTSNNSSVLPRFAPLLYFYSISLHCLLPFLDLVTSTALNLSFSFSDRKRRRSTVAQDSRAYPRMALNLEKQLLFVSRLKWPKLKRRYSLQS